MSFALALLLLQPLPARAAFTEISAHAPSWSYLVRRVKDALVFEGGPAPRTIAVKPCNAELVADFFKDYEQTRSAYVAPPAPLLGSSAITLEGANPSRVAARSKFGWWLHDIPVKLQKLALESRVRCGQ